MLLYIFITSFFIVTTVVIVLFYLRLRKNATYMYKDLRYCVEQILKRGFNNGSLTIKPIKSLTKCRLKLVKYITSSNYGIVLNFKCIGYDEHGTQLVKYCTSKKIPYQINEKNSNLKYIEIDFKKDVDKAFKMITHIYFRIFELKKDVAFYVKVADLAYSDVLVATMEKEKYFKQKRTSWFSAIIKFIIIFMAVFITILYGIFRRLFHFLIGKSGGSRSGVGSKNSIQRNKD